MVVAIKYQEDSQTEYNETKDEEQQEEVLNVMTEIHSIILALSIILCKCRIRDSEMILVFSSLLIL